MMATRCMKRMSSWRVVWLVTGLVTWCAELSMNFCACVALVASAQLVPLSVLVGVMLVSSVAVSFFSYTMLLDSAANSTGSAILHLLQLGIPARYLRMLLSSTCWPPDSASLLSAARLRALHAVGCSLPCLLLHVYVLLTPAGVPLLPYAHYLVASASGCCLASAVWAFVTYSKPSRRRLTALVLLTRTLWRSGEVASRTLLFAILFRLPLHTLVAAGLLHCLVVLSALLWEQRGVVVSKVGVPLGKVIATSFCYLFCYMNLGLQHKKFHVAALYSLMAAEIAAMLLVWSIRPAYLEHPDWPVVGGVLGSFALAIVSCICYYQFAVRNNPEIEMVKEKEETPGDCINCRISCCSKHSIKRQRPPPVNNQTRVIPAKPRLPVIDEAVSLTAPIDVHVYQIACRSPSAPSDEDLPSDYIWDDYDLHMPDQRITPSSCRSHVRRTPTPLLGISARNASLDTLSRARSESGISISASMTSARHCHVESECESGIASGSSELESFVSESLKATFAKMPLRDYGKSKRPVTDVSVRVNRSPLQLERYLLQLDKLRVGAHGCDNRHHGSLSSGVSTGGFRSDVASVSSSEIGQVEETANASNKRQSVLTHTVKTKKNSNNKFAVDTYFIEEKKNRDNLVKLHASAIALQRCNHVRTFKKSEECYKPANRKIYTPKGVVSYFEYEEII